MPTLSHGGYGWAGDKAMPNPEGAAERSAAAARWG